MRVKRLSARWGIGALSFVLLMPTPPSLDGQSLLVRVEQQATGRPLSGALVTLRGDGLELVRRALTTEAGRYLFAGLVPGVYSLSAELIGHETATTTGVVVSAAETAVAHLTMAEKAIVLEGLSVRGEPRCRVNPSEGQRVASVWHEVRKALSLTEWTRERGVYDFRLRRYAREVKSSDGSVVRQVEDDSAGFFKTPYESLPVADLLANGFVQPSEDGRSDEYFAPDASVLMSPEFVETHCFRLRAGDARRSGQVGLSFEPVRRGSVPDIEGTLWMDGGSWRLLDLEYAYVGFSTSVELEGVGGQVSFRGLPNGTWIVPEWEIRMPWLSYYRDAGGIRRLYQAGHRIEGGVVLTVRESTGETVLTAATSTIEGYVGSGPDLSPLKGVAIHLLGTDLNTVSSIEGRFRFAELLPGVYDVEFTHPLLSGYGYRPDPVRHVAIEGEITELRLEVPDQTGLLALGCAAALGARPPGSTVLLGRVFDPATSEPLAGAGVEIRWTDYRFEARSARGGGQVPVGESSAAPQAGVRGWDFKLGVSEQGVLARTDGEGFYRACVVPEDTPLTVVASWGPFSGSTQTVRVPEEVRAEVLDIPIQRTREGGSTISPG